jgi:hypothetical protein
MREPTIQCSSCGKTVPIRFSVFIGDNHYCNKFCCNETQPNGADNERDSESSTPPSHYIDHGGSTRG